MVALSLAILVVIVLLMVLPGNGTPGQQVKDVTTSLLVVTMVYGQAQKT